MAFTNLVPWKRDEKNVTVKLDEYDPFRTLQRSMNRLFDDFTSNIGLAAIEPFGAFSPRIDVTENDTEFVVSAELPGLDENDVEVSLAHNVLTVSGEKKEETEDKGENFYRMERSYGTFQRRVSLPVEVETDKVEAKFKKGVLIVTLPKTAEAQKQSRRIPVRTS